MYFSILRKTILTHCSSITISHNIDFFHVDKSVEKQYDCMMQELRFFHNFILFFCTRAENKTQDGVSYEIVSIPLMFC